MAAVHHPIKVVAQLTGLSAHVIRIWEQRHEAVVPERTATNRRLYSQAQIERLNLLRQVTQAGHSIGLVAKLPVAKLRQLAAEIPGTRSRASSEGRRSRGRTEGLGVAGILEACVAAIKSLNTAKLEESLSRGATELGGLGALQRMVAPLLHRLGELWAQGTLTAAHEHFASGEIRAFLTQATKPFGDVRNAPVLVAATPAGQMHELGALLAGATAAHLGWQVKQLGASLPAAEIAGAARQTLARAVALSLVYPEDDGGLPDELTRLRRLLPPEVALVVGGRAAPAYQETLKQLAAVQVQDLAELIAALDNLRKPERKHP